VSAAEEPEFFDKAEDRLSKWIFTMLFRRFQA
jgi:hypothetical protein